LPEVGLLHWWPHAITLVASVRPELHRYCARLTGSVIEGEDIVQDTLARAFYAMSQTLEVPPLRPWLFRIAHNAAIDFLRSRRRRQTEPIDEVDEVTRSSSTTTHRILSSCAARSRAFSRYPSHSGAPSFRRTCSDWDGVRALVGDDCRLDLVAKSQRRGKEVGLYFGNYAKTDVQLRVVRLEGQLALAAHGGNAEVPSYFILLAFEGGKVTTIRDYRYVPYIALEAEIEKA
jgi:RNA polymerase sigma-70 factor (ECF subfamily)